MNTKGSCSWPTISTGWKVLGKKPEITEVGPLPHAGLFPADRRGGEQAKTCPK
jgi:hypothetical protein